MQSLQDKQKNNLKNACSCEEEMQRLSEEREEQKGAVRDACPGSVGEVRRQSEGSS